MTAALASCGGEKTLTAEEFVGEINGSGVEMGLGQELLTTEEGKRLYEVELEPLPATEPESAGDPDHAHTSGSLAVYEGGEGAEGGLDQCRAAADLLCYRAANIVIVLEGGGTEAQRLAVAIRRLAEE